MEDTIKRLSKWYNIPTEQAEDLVEQALADIKAIQTRLDDFYLKGKDFAYVMKELDGFNLEDDTFEVEFNEENFIIKKDKDGFCVGTTVLITLPNDECLEPFEFELK